MITLINQPAFSDEFNGNGIDQGWASGAERTNATEGIRAVGFFDCVGLISFTVQHNLLHHGMVFFGPSGYGCIHCFQQVCNKPAVYASPYRELRKVVLNVFLPGFKHICFFQVRAEAFKLNIKVQQ